MIGASSRKLGISDPLTVETNSQQILRHSFASPSHTSLSEWKGLFRVIKNASGRSPGASGFTIDWFSENFGRCLVLDTFRGLNITSLTLKGEFQGKIVDEAPTSLC